MVSPKLAAVVRKFPEPAVLERRFRILTIIEAITNNWGYRHYYYSKSTENPSLRIAFYDSGSGDHARIFFDDGLTFISAFDHESATNPWVTGKIWPGILQDVPAGCRRFIRGYTLEITAALWHVGDGWKHGSPEPLYDGQEPEATFWMFDPVVDNFSARALAEDFSDLTSSHIVPESLRPLLGESPLTEAIIYQLNPEANREYIKQVAEDSGYPSQL